MRGGGRLSMGKLYICVLVSPHRLSQPRFPAISLGTEFKETTESTVIGLIAHYHVIMIIEHASGQERISTDTMSFRFTNALVVVSN